MVISHATYDMLTAAAMEAAVKIYRDAGISVAIRDRAEVEWFFDGLKLIEPGVQPILAWRPDGVEAGWHNEARVYGVIGRKP